MVTKTSIMEKLGQAGIHKTQQVDIEVYPSQSREYNGLAGKAW